MRTPSGARDVDPVKLVWSSVESVESTPGGALRCGVVLDVTGDSGVAICYPDLTGPVAVGDRLLLNTTAVDLSLGTGGVHFGVAVGPVTDGGGGPGAGVALDAPSGGHIMKLRYTPLQRDVLSVESPESPFHNTMARVEDLDGIPVVCCSLHSQVPLVAAAFKHAAPHLRVGYCMTDEAALPLAFSNVIAQSKAAGLIDFTVTCGQAFGGDYEAVTLHSGLLAACHIGGADVVIVSIGPGVVGTATPFGHGGIAQGEAINAVGALRGLPIACLRLSFADGRPRHRGLSHHTATALTRIALTKALIAVPHLADPQQASELGQALDSLDCAVEHEGMEVEYAAYSEVAMRGVHVTTMGRSYADDPAFFEAASAAGIVAAIVATQDEGSTEGCGG